MRSPRLTPYNLMAPETVLEIKLPGTLPIPMQDLVELRAFLQAMLFRAGVGHVRYGSPATQKKYLTRLSKELKAYKETGNAESLFNIAVYAWLESFAPEHKNQHWDMAAESVTRGTMGGALE